MASRREQKEQARAKRVAAEQTATQHAQRTRRVQMLGGVIGVAVVTIVVAIVISSSSSHPAATKPDSAAATTAEAHVEKLLHAIPQSGDTLGHATAPVTVTEYGDLQCSVCDMFAAPPSFTNPEGETGTGLEDELIDQYVRTGKVKLVYRSLETASLSNPNPNAFDLQQAAADAAGLQGKAWNYTELFYNEQDAEGAGYVTNHFLKGLATQIRRS